jgi:GMP synthase (glutamine-hydrolysing)
MPFEPPESILIVDFGSQVTQLIARRVREAGVYSEIAPFTAAAAAFERMKPAGVILSGSPASVLDVEGPRIPEPILGSGLPMLGICYGQQALMHQLGGEVVLGEAGEFGRAFIEIGDSCALFDGLWSEGERHQVWMSHGDKVTTLAPGFRSVAASPGSPYAVVADDERRIYATQFHMEVVHTPDGARLIKNFVRHVCGLSGEWTMAEFRKTKIEEIRAQVGKGKVICGLSGGVDSAVAAVLIPRGDRRAADLRVRGPRPAADGRGRAGGGAVPRPLQHPADPQGRLGAVPQGPGRRHRSRGQAQVHRQDLHRRVRGRSEGDRRRRVPRPGHALS